MDNSWTFNLKIDSTLIRQEDWKTRLNQVSPLRFKSEAEAYKFGKKVFEPPLSVTKWTVVGSERTPNFPLKKSNYSE